MKHATRTLLPALVLVLLAGRATAQTEQLRINEIHYADGWVELHYPATASGQIDASGLCLCSRPQYIDLGSLTVLSGSTTLDPGDFLVVSWTHAGNFNTSEGEVALYDGCSGFTDPANMIDYVEYGASHGGTAGREDVAVAKGIWNAGTFVDLAPSGKSLAFFGGFGASGWAAGEPTLGLDNTPLPVELTAFTARADGPAILLAWTTASETNNAGFEIQFRERDDWRALGFVEGKGTTTEAQSYRFRVERLAPGRYTFRLKQIDFDGSFAFGPSVEVLVEPPGAFHLSPAFPNPFHPATRFTLTVRRGQSVRVEVFDLLGRRRAMLHDGFLSSGDAHAFRFDAAGLPSGPYLVRATGERFVATRPVTLLR
jgi:hypothetical protein